jgi:hypothetical protein
MKARFPHQKEWFEKTKDRPFFAFEWEVRGGKSIPAIDTAVYNFEQGRIDAVLLVCPNMVDLNWSRINLFEYLLEMKAGHLEDLNKNSIKVMEESKILEWNRSESKATKQSREDILSHPGLIWFCVNLEGIADRMNSKGRVVSSRMQEYIEVFLKRRKVMLVLDESHKFKSPTSACTKAMIRLAPDTIMRRNLTGTPSGGSPFDLWSQYHIGDMFIIHNELGQPMIWTDFKNTFAIWKREYAYGRSFNVIDTSQGDAGYHNLDKLYAMIDPHRSRITQKELKEMYPATFGFFKEPVEEKRVFEMAPHQWKVYCEIRDEMIAQLDSGETITAEQKMTNMLRLQQISRGYVGGVTPGQVIDLGPPYPSIDALLGDIEQVEGKIIVWCNFTPDVELILRSLYKEKIRAVRYDGLVSKEDRLKNMQQMWEDPTLRVMVGNPAAGAIGSDFAFAATMINYSFDYDLIKRAQAIGRFQGPKQTAAALLLVDFVAANTNDIVCLSRLESKMEINDILTGDSERFKKFLLGERL